MNEYGLGDYVAMLLGACVLGIGFFSTVGLIVHFLDKALADVKRRRRK